MMKKTLSAIFAAFMILTLTACGGDSTPHAASGDAAGTAQVDQAGDNASSAPRDPAAPEASDPATPTDATEPTTAPDTTNPPAVADAPLALNTASTLNDWSINVTSMEIKQTIPNGEYFAFEADEGNKYLVASVYVENNAKTAQTFLQSYAFEDVLSVKLTYGDGYEYPANILLGSDTDLHDAVVNPLASKSGIIAFEVPDVVANSSDSILLEFSEDSNRVVYVLR